MSDTTADLPVHRYTGQQALGYTSRGPIWPVAGGSGEGDGGGQGGSGQGDADAGGDQGGAQGDAGGSGNAGGAQGSAGGQQGGSGDAGGSQGDAQRVEDLPEWAQKVIRETRKEAGDHRTKATAAQQQHEAMLDGIAKALGLKKDEAPDPAKLAEQLSTTQDAARQSAVELAVYKAASKHGADPDALLDSRAFLAKVKDLDPSTDGFATKVADVIKKAVGDNPKLKTGQAPAASGAEFTGGSGGGAKKSKSLADAVASRYR